MSLTLTPLEFIEGLFNVIIVIITASIGILIILKYKKYKKKQFFYYGLGFFGIYSPFWPSTLSFLIIIISQNENFAINNMCLWTGIWVLPSPFFLLMWVLGFFELVPQKKKEMILLIIITISIIFEFLTIYFILTHQCDKLGRFNGLFDISFSLTIIIWALFVTTIVSFTGILIGANALKAKKKHLKIKGIFLLYSFIIYPVAAIIDGGMNLNSWGVIIIRTIELSVSITFYIGMFLPNFIKKIFKISKD